MLPLIGVSPATFDSTEEYVSKWCLQSDQYFKNRSYGSKCVQNNRNYILYYTSCQSYVVIEFFSWPFCFYFLDCHQDLERNIYAMWKFYTGHLSIKGNNNISDSDST